ncbi:hypothetical protein ACWODG_06800 [Enterococcus italicus]
MDVITIKSPSGTFNLSDLGFRWHREHEALGTADFSLRSDHIPGKTGDWYFGSEVGTKEYEFTLSLLEDDLTTLDQKIAELNDVLFDAYGKPQLLEITLDYTRKMFYAYFSEPIAPTTETILSKMKLTFVSFDGKKYSADKASEFLWGSEKINFKANYKLGDTGTGANALTITSNQSLDTFVDGKAVKPSIKIVGTGTNVKLTCAGRSIAVGTFTSKTIAIDTEMFIAYFDGVETLIDMDDFYIVPNAKVSVTGTGMNFVLTIDYQNVYM